MTPHRFLSVVALTFLPSLAPTQSIYLVASLTGERRVPPTPSIGLGTGVVRLEPASGVVSVFVAVESPLDAATAVRLHQGVAGANGPGILDLAGGPVDFTATATLNAAQVAALQSDGCYLSVETTQYPGGATRGQVTTARHRRFMASLSGAQVVPSVATLALGSADLHLFEPDNIVQVDLSGGSIGTPTGAHIHQAPRGSNGAILFTLTPGRSCSVFNFSDALVAALESEQLYVDVHTAVFPNGETRGQLVPAAIETSRGVMRGSEVVPPTTSAATAPLAVQLLLDARLSYSIVATGLSSTALSAHLRQASTGANGPLVATLALIGSGTWIGTTVPLTAPQLVAVRAGDMYCDVRTTNFPGGEIRRQVHLSRAPVTFGRPSHGTWLRANEPPQVGATLVLRSTGSGPGLPALFYLGFNRDSMQGLPLPLNLSPFLNTTRTYLFIDFTPLPPLVAITDQLGCASVSLPVPAQVELAGSPVLAQLILLDSFVRGGFATSNALNMSIQP